MPASKVDFDSIFCQSCSVVYLLVKFVIVDLNLHICSANVTDCF